MTSPIHLVGEHDDRQRIINAARAYRIDGLAPDRREAVLAAERYLDGESPYGKIMNQRLKFWRAQLRGDFVSHGWLKAANR